MNTNRPNTRYCLGIVYVKMVIETVSKPKQDRQCTFYVTLRCVRVTIEAVEKQSPLSFLSVCFCSLSYPTYNVDVPYCHLWFAWLYQIFPHYLINGTIFEKQLLNIRCLFRFSLQTLSEIFLILRRNERNMYIGLHVKYPLFLSHFNGT